MSDLQEVRRANLRKIVERENATKVAKKLGYRSPSFLSQMIGPNPSRDITEKNARRYENDLGLDPGALDVGEVVAPPAPAAAPTLPGMDVQVISDVVRMVGSICAGENVSLGPEKFSELIALALVDSVEHGGKPREQQIRSVVRLLK